MEHTVHRIFAESGLPLHGFCPFSAIEDRLLPCRGRDRLWEVFPPEAPTKTVIAALFPYRFPDEKIPSGLPGENGRENLSRYARVPDYHLAAGAVLKQAAGRLAETFPGERFLPFIDSSPIPEVRTAALAGLGVVGEHGLLIHPEYGSWVFIGTITTSLALGGPVSDPPPHCPRCGRCAAVCPGDCLGSPSAGRETCLSAITQKKGELTPGEADRIRRSGMAWGCDFCQEACPLNRNVRIAPHPCFGGRYERMLTEESLQDLQGKAYGWRGKKVLLRNLSLIDGKGG